MAASIWDPGSLADLSTLEYNATTVYPSKSYGKHLRDQGIVVTDSPFLANGGGVVDVTSSLQSAVNEFGVAGGSLILPAGWKGYVAGNLSVPKNVTIRTAHEMMGAPGINTSAPYQNLGALILGSSARISFAGNAGLDGALVYRAGMTFPNLTASNFAGTAIEFLEDDAFVVNSMIMGFTQGITMSGVQRPRLYNLNMDCTNGIDIINCADVSYLNKVHQWPFSTIVAVANGLSPGTELRRLGKAFKLSVLGDWAKLTDCFSYGYEQGYYLDSCNSWTLQGCGADNTQGWASIGFVITAGCTDGRLLGCQAAAQGTGYYQETFSGLHTQYIGCDSWFNASHGMQLIGGDATWIGGTNRNTGNGFTVTNANSILGVDYCRFNDITGVPFNPTVSTSNLKIGRNNTYGNFTGAAVGSNSVSKSVASASAITATPGFDFYTVTGTTGIGTINAGWAGRRLELIFTAACSVFHSIASNGIALNGGATFSAVANSTLSLVHNGTQWFEVGRKA